MRVTVWVRLLMLTVSLSALSTRAEAIPVLQLDMRGGTYDTATESIVAPGGLFTVYAILTPQNNTSAVKLTELLNETYYISVAITPQVSTRSSLGSFTFGEVGTSPQLVSATSGMVFGTPPLENLPSAQGHDAGDLPRHGTYPTYFEEFSFQFSRDNRNLAYNTQDNPGGLTDADNGGAYYVAFSGDSRLLQSGYQLHFDLYDTVARNCSSTGTCRDIDVDRFAPFSHDAQTVAAPPPPPPPPPPHSVPEPTTGLLMLAGAGAMTFFRRRFTN